MKEWVVVGKIVRGAGFLLAAALSFPAFASQNLVIVDPTITGFVDAPSIDQLFNEIEPLFQNLKTSSGVTVGVVRNLQGGAHFVYRTNRIEIGSYMISYAKPETLPAVAATLQHEYGHSVFFASMGQYSAKWQEWFDHRGEPEPTGIFARVAALFNPPEPQPMLSISIPYQELFADAVAVLASHDPEIMVKALRELGFDEPALFESRSFSGEAFDSKWGNYEEHLAFAPVRSYLWNRYFSQAKNRGREAEMLTALFHVMAKEVVARTETARLIYLEPGPMNMRLLNAIHEAFVDFE